MSSKELGDTIKLQGEIDDLRSKQVELESKMEEKLEAEAKGKLVSDFRRALMEEYKERVGDLVPTTYDIVSRLGRRSNMCPGGQCGPPLTHSKLEWDTFLSEKEEQIRKQLDTMGFVLPSDTDIKSDLIRSFKDRGINHMDDIKDVDLIEGIISEYIANLTAAFTTQGEGSAITEGGGGKRRKKYSKKKEEIKEERKI